MRSWFYSIRGCEMAPPPDHKRFNLAVARIIPLVLLGIVIYACYIITKTLAVDYLIHPALRYNHHRSRVGTGAAIISVFYVLLLLVVVTYLRLLYNVVWNTGYLPQGPQPAPHNHDTQRSHRHRRRKKSRRRSRTTDSSDKHEVDTERGFYHYPRESVAPWDIAGLESFYKKDVFICQADGRPMYCSTCLCYKPDRAHHCREVNRCIRKMDHFCPWVGGVVSETSFKFFIQFIFYTTIFCIFTLVVCAVFTAELKREAYDINVHWVVGIGLSSLFGIFTFGMALSSLQLAMYNLTTIENLSRRSVVWTLAIRVPRHILARLSPGSQWAPTFRTITYPLPLAQPAIPPHQKVGEDPQSLPPLPPAGEQHTFAILQTLPGENPFDLGSPLKNLQQVLGFSILDWFLPLKHSPCADHRTLESEFALGPVVSRLKKEAGLEPPVEREGEPIERRPKRKRRPR